MPNDPRQHHFVAAGYLKPWASGRRRTLYAFDVERGSWLPNQKPANVAKDRDFYLVDAPGLEPTAVEVEVLADFEAKALPVIADIIAGRFPIAKSIKRFVSTRLGLRFITATQRSDRNAARSSSAKS